MKTLLFCTTHERYPRQIKWRDYYTPRRQHFGASNLFMIDDASLLEDLRNKVRNQVICAEALPITLENIPPVATVRFETKLGRFGTRVYPGWWRSFLFAHTLAVRYGFKKIIHIESDAFVVSTAMANCIKYINSGWSVFWCPSWKWPETSIQVICEDQYDKLTTLKNKGSAYFASSSTPIAEKILPFTTIIKTYIGDRYGDRKGQIILPEHVDYLCQMDITKIGDFEIQTELGES